MNQTSEKKESAFGALKLALDFIDISSEYFPEAKDMKVEHLLLPLNTKVTPSLKIQLHYLNDLDKARGIEDDDDELLLLQFFVEIPWKVPDDKALSVVLVFLRLNGLIPFGNFGITDEGLFFRFVYPSRERVKNNGLIVMILDSISRYVSAIVPNLSELLNEKKTAEQAFKDSMKNIESIVVK
jgi:hypothetical protein